MTSLLAEALCGVSPTVTVLRVACCGGVKPQYNQTKPTVTLGGL